MAYENTIEINNSTWTEVPLQKGSYYIESVDPSTVIEYSLDSNGQDAFTITSGSAQYTLDTPSSLYFKASSLFNGKTTKVYINDYSTKAAAPLAAPQSQSISISNQWTQLTLSAGSYFILPESGSLIVSMSLSATGDNSKTLKRGGEQISLNAPTSIYFKLNTEDTNAVAKIKYNTINVIASTGSSGSTGGGSGGVSYGFNSPLYESNGVVSLRYSDGLVLKNNNLVVDLNSNQEIISMKQSIDEAKTVASFIEIGRVRPLENHFTIDADGNLGLDLTDTGVLTLNFVSNQKFDDLKLIVDQNTSSINDIKSDIGTLQDIDFTGSNITDILKSVKVEVDKKLDTDVYNTEKAEFATKTELADKADVVDLNALRDEVVLKTNTNQDIDGIKNFLNETKSISFVATTKMELNNENGYFVITNSADRQNELFKIGFVENNNDIDVVNNSGGNFTFNSKIKYKTYIKATDNEDLVCLKDLNDSLSNLNVDSFEIEKGLVDHLESGNIDISNREWNTSVGNINATWPENTGNYSISEENKCLRVIGSSDSVDVSKVPSVDLSSFISNINGFTLEVTFKVGASMDSNNFGQWPSIFSITNSNYSNNPIFTMGLTRANSADNLALNYHISQNPSNTNYSQYNLQANEKAPLDQFNTISMVFTNNTVITYLNAEEVSSTNVTYDNFNSFAMLIIGNGSRFNGKVNWLFKDVKIYNRALNKTEIISNYAKANLTPLESLIEAEQSIEEEQVVDVEWINSEILDGSISILKAGETILGNDIYNYSGSKNVFCIPSTVFGYDGSLYQFSDYRINYNDQVPICIVGAKTKDRYNWTKYTVIPRPSGTASQARTMDCTSVAIPPIESQLGQPDNYGRIMVLAGKWTTGSSNWQSGTSADSWESAYLFYDDNGLNTVTDNVVQGTLRTIGKSGSDITPTNFPADCKGFLGGVGTGIWTSDNKVVFPIQWTKGTGDIRAGMIWSDDRGESNWVWGTGEVLNVGENMIFERHVDGGQNELIMFGRNYSSTETDYCIVSSSTDMGETWNILSDAGGRYYRKIGLANVQGSVLTFEYAGVRCYVYCRIKSRQNANGTVSGNRRRELTITAFRDDGVKVETRDLFTFTDDHARSYNSLAFDPSTNGLGRLVVSYETEPSYDGTIEHTNTIRLRDITYLLDDIATFCSYGKYGVYGEKITELENKIGDTNNSLIPTDDLLYYFNKKGLSSDKRSWTCSVSGQVLSMYGSSTPDAISDDDTYEDLVKFTTNSSNKTGYHAALPSGDANKIKDCTTLTIFANVKMPDVTGQTDANLQLMNAWSHVFNVASPSYSYRAAISCVGTNEALNGWEPKGKVSGEGQAQTISTPFTKLKRQVVAVVYGENDYKVYLDGQLVKTNTRNGTNYLFSDLDGGWMDLGNREAGGNPKNIVNWSIGEIAIYGREFNEDEVLDYTKIQRNANSAVGSLDDLTTPAKTVVEAINNLESNSVLKTGDQVMEGKLTSNSGLKVLKQDASIELTDSQSDVGATISVMDNGENIKISVGSNGNGSIQFNGKTRYPWNSIPTVTNDNEIPSYKQIKDEFASKTDLDTKLDTTTYEAEKSDFATKAELDTKADISSVTELNDKAVLTTNVEQDIEGKKNFTGTILSQTSDRTYGSNRYYADNDSTGLGQPVFNTYGTKTEKQATVGFSDASNQGKFEIKVENLPSRPNPTISLGNDTEIDGTLTVTGNITAPNMPKVLPAGTQPTTADIGAMQFCYVLRRI